MLNYIYLLSASVIFNHGEPTPEDLENKRLYEDLEWNVEHNPDWHLSPEKSVEYEHMTQEDYEKEYERYKMIRESKG